MQNQQTYGGNDLAEPVMAVPLAYNTQQTGPCMRPSCRRVTTNVFPNTNVDITSNLSNRVLRFGVSAEGFLDGKSSYLAFDLKGAGTGTASFIQTTEAMFTRISIYSNSGVLIEDIQNQELLGCILYRDTPIQYSSSVGHASLGMNNEDALAQYRFTQKQRYVCELRASGFLNAFNYIPCRAMANTQSYAFFIEVEFAPKERMITQTAPNTDATYTVSNCVYVADIVYDDIKEEQINSMLMDGPLVFHFQTWRHHDNILKQNSLNNQFTVSEFQESLQEIALVFKKTNNSINDRYIDFNFPNATEKIKDIQLKIGNYLYPAQPIPMTQGYGQQYYELFKAEEKNRKHYDGNRALKPVAGNQLYSNEEIDFIFRYPLRIMPTDANGPTVDYFFGINTRKNPQSINVLLNTVGNTSQDYTMSFYVKYDVSLVINKNENYIVS